MLIKIVSIARRLTRKKLERAKSLFFLIDVHFLFDSTVLQKLDGNIKQFFAIDQFKCDNNPQPEGIQGTLF